MDPSPFSATASGISCPSPIDRPPRKQWILIQKTGKSAYWLDEEIVTSIGTDGCDIIIQSPTVDPQHAVIWFDPDSSYFYLKDLDTGSGTFLNGKKMSSSISTKLRNMDFIRFGFDSNLYQIRLEATDGSSRNVAGAAESQNHKDMDLELDGTMELPPPKSSKTFECDDSGNCSSSSPSSPVKPCAFPTIIPSTNPRSAGGTSSPQSASEELFSNKYSPMAFTVDFGPTETKVLGIMDSISKYAPPRHRRTMSQPKVERKVNSEGGESGTSKSKSGHTHSTSSESDYRKGKGVKKVPNQETIPSNQRASGNTPLSHQPNPENPATRASERSSKVVTSTHLEDDRMSEAGTYTVELDDAEEVGKEVGRFGREDELETESPMDSSLEWVREWAERATKEIEQHPSQRRTIYEPETTFTRSSLEKLGNAKGSNQLRNSWHEEVETSRVRERGRSPHSSTHRLARETSAVSDYAAYERNGPIQRHRQLRPSTSHSPALSRREGATAAASGGQNLSEQLALQNFPLTPNSPVSLSPSTSPFSRNDGGRFSLRAANKLKSTTPTQLPPAAAQVPSHPPKKGSALPRLSQPRSVATVAPSTKPSPAETPAKKPPEKLKGPHKPLLSSGKRANSTLTAKEVELANWNRRKSYDPMKAAALGKKKDKKSPLESDSFGDNEPGQRINPDGAASISKSPSFHNSVTYRHLGSSAEELGSEEEIEDPPAHAQYTGSLTRLGSMNMQRRQPEEVSYTNYPTSNIPRPKHKFEALDCLVISTIHSLSNKVRVSSRLLLEKIQLTPSDDENGALVEEMISQLKELEMSSPNKGSSRELSGTLKNLKKLEQVILVLDRILCGESDDM